MQTTLCHPCTVIFFHEVACRRYYIAWFIEGIRRYVCQLKFKDIARHLLCHQFCKSVLCMAHCRVYGCISQSYFRPQDCHQLWQSSIHLSANKRVPCSSWLSPWSGQVQRDACWHPRLATLWPHKLSLTVTSWSCSASGHIYSSGWRDEVRLGSDISRYMSAEWQLKCYDLLKLN